MTASTRLRKRGFSCDRGRMPRDATGRNTIRSRCRIASGTTRTDASRKLATDPRGHERSLAAALGKVVHGAPFKHHQGPRLMKANRRDGVLQERMQPLGRGSLGRRQLNPVGQGFERLRLVHVGRVFLQEGGDQCALARAMGPGDRDSQGLSLMVRHRWPAPVRVVKLRPKRHEQTQAVLAPSAGGSSLRVERTE
mgnify:CR=1 FL=1